MKILEIELLAYGPFTDTTLDLSGGDCGLHIVYGPNEAGKSSTLRAIQGLLYGIPTKTTDNFLHDNKKLRLGGRLLNSSGEEIHFHRRKGNKDTILNPKAAKGGAYPDEVLEPYVRGVDRDAFARVYGIGNEQLEEGGSEMKALRGLVGESLFAATVGGPGLAVLLNQLDQDAAALFDSRKRTARLKALAGRHKDLSAARRSVQLGKANWERLQSELRKARQQRDEIVDREKELSKQLRRLKRIESGLGLIARRRDIVRRIEELSGVVVLPEGYSAEERNRAEADLASVRRRIEQLRQRAEEYQQQIKGIVVPEGLLDFEDAINDLKDHRAVTVRAERDTADLQRNIEVLQGQAAEVLRDLGIDGSLDDAEQYRLKSEDQVAIRNLASDAKRLREEPGRLRQQREDLEAQAALLQEQLDGMGAAADVSQLQAALVDVGRVGESQDQLERLRHEYTQSLRAVEKRFATLGLWSGALKDLGHLSVPLEETVERFREDFAQHERAVEVLCNENERLLDELGQVQQEIATLQTAGSVPTETELNDLRAERDAAWQDVRDDWLRGAFTKSMPIDDAEALGVRFARSISESDQLADRLRRETERVAQLAAQTARRSRIEQQLEQLKVVQAKHSKSQTSLRKEWKKLWKPSGIVEPLSPAEMIGWLRRLDELRDLVANTEEQQERISMLAASLDDAAALLRSCLNTAGVDATASNTEALIAQARQIVEREAEAVSRRDRLGSEIQQIAAHCEKLKRDERRAVGELEAWQETWSSRMEQLGCQPEAIAEQANERISSLNRLFEFVRQIREEQRRINDIRSDAERFEAEAKQLASRFLGRSDVVATELAIELHNALQTAKSEQSRLESIQEALHNATAETIELEKQEAALLHELQTLCQLAGVTDIAMLPEKEQKSVELAEQSRRLREIEDQLHEQTAGLPLADFVADADSVDADELPQQIGRIERELAELEDSRDSAVVAVNELEKQARQADGNDKAANLDQEALGVLSTMHDEAQRYMQLRLASTMLRRQIEIHRAENEDPLLQRANDLFARMTCDEFSGLRTDYQNDQPVIVGTRASGELVGVEAMSDGTRNQLYLALRLAYVEYQLVKYEPMPFVVDDILVHFDDTRSKATLQVLSELAQQTQVIFLTHHSHLLELARGNLPADQLFIHHLDSRDRDAAGDRRAPKLPR